MISGLKENIYFYYKSERIKSVTDFRSASFEIKADVNK